MRDAIWPARLVDVQRGQSSPNSFLVELNLRLNLSSGTAELSAALFLGHPKSSSL